jgi:hypothetical protein
MSEKGGRELQQAAMNLSILPVEEDKNVSVEPAPGSYEKLRGMFS